MAEKKVELFKAHQHISNGGITYELERTEHPSATGKPYVLLNLVTGLSNMGIETSFKVPVFHATAAVLRAVADQIEMQDGDGDHAYMRPIRVDVKIPGQPEKTFTGPEEDQKPEGGLTSYVKTWVKEVAAARNATLTVVPADDLNTLMMQHRIGLVCEYQSKLWTAEVYDDDATEPTRVASSESPLAAVLLALTLPIPQPKDD